MSDSGDDMTESGEYLTVVMTRLSLVNICVDHMTDSGEYLTVMITWLTGEYLTVVMT